MESFFFVVLLSFIFVSSNVSAEVTSLMSDADVPCIGDTVTLTCTVSGTNLGWQYGGFGGQVYISPSGPNSLQLLGSGPFSTRVTNVSDGVITSIATATLTGDVNEMILECSDGSFTSSSTDIKNASFYLGDFIRPLLTDPTYSDTTIYSFLKLNKCNPACKRDVINETGVVNTTDCSSTIFYTPPQNQRDVYTFNVSNLDSNGQSIASSSFNFRWDIFDFEVEDDLYNTINSNILIITIMVPSINQPKMLTCDLIFTGCENSNDILCNSSRTCIVDKVFQLENVTEGNYIYNVTITNARGLSNRTGDFQVAIEKPTSSAMTIVSSTTSVISSSPTPSPNSTSSDQDNTTNTIALAITLGLSGLWCVLSVPWCILHLCWRHCFCCLALWTLSIWRYVFCECFRKEPKPDANVAPSAETTTFKFESIKKDESNL